MRVVAQTQNHKEIEYQGRTYRARNGVFDLPEHVAQHAIKHEVGQAATLGVHASRSIGHRCTCCGFGPFFNWCSRCRTRECGCGGNECVREG